MKLRLSSVLFVAALTLALTVDMLFYSAPNIGINMFLMELFFLGVSAWLAKAQKVEITTPTKVAAGFALAFSATFAIWTSPWSLAMDFIGFLVANTLFAVFLLGEAAHFRHPFDVVGHLLIAPITHGLRTLPFVCTLMPEKATPRTRSIVKAVLIAFPILLVFTFIFIAADAVFRSLVVDAFQGIAAWADIGNVIGHIFFIGLFFVLFFLFFAAAFWQRKTTEKTYAAATARAVLESKIILGSVAGLFAIFLFVSFFALFGGESAFRELDITYAEYARQGFGQLCAAATLVLGLVMTLRVLHTEAVDKQLLGLQVALLVEAGFVLISAFMRLGMYIDAYGFSPARLFGLWFFALITAFLALTLVNVTARKRQSQLMTQMLVVSGAAILLFTIIGPDAFASRLNAHRTDVDEEAWTHGTTSDTWQSWNYTRMMERRIGRQAQE